MSDVANTILAQLGGARFITMTGTRGFASDKDCLIFKLPRGAAKDKITAVRVRLLPTDTYEVKFYRQAGAPTYKVDVVAEFDGVYNGDLQRIFTSATGLATSL